MPSADTISNKFQLTPVQDFGYLRETGLKYIQRLSGKLWTDHNLHDPGITILEVLCYALIDLGYRSSFDIKDIIAQKDGPVSEGYFHKAASIFTTRPVTVNDYRKILIDIPGIRNAWLFARDGSAKPFDEGVHIYAYCKESRLLYESQIPTINLNDQQHVREQERVYVDGLYAVKLELEEHPLFGDLNSSIVQARSVTGELSGYKMEISFPVWSSKDKNGKELVSMFKAEKIDSISIEVINDTKLNPADFLKVKRSAFKTVWTIKYNSGERTLGNVAIKVISAPASANGLVVAVSLQKGLNENNAAIAADALKKFSVRPVEMFKIFDAARKKLMQSRNLCEDFLYGVDIIDTEDLVICADMDVEINADLEQIQAQVFALIENYLLPPVQFSTLQELLDQNIPTEEVFNGPLLQHGFLTEEAIKKADIKGEYYISDIKSLLMDIPGVINLRNLKFSVFKNDDLPSPQQDDWRIKVSPNHKLRLSREKCKFLFYKNSLPLLADFNESVNKLRLTQTLQNHLKFKNPENDIPVPAGKYRNLDKHYSILNEFPQVYGLGDKDLPGLSEKEIAEETLSEEQTKRLAQVRQMEAYLTFFDQLIANYFGQLNHVKELLSWNEDVKQTYMAQYFYSDKDAANLFDSFQWIKNKVDDSYLNSIGLHANAENKSQCDYIKANTGLQHVTESYTVYLDRRNRLLDHLVARFAESFNDYAVHMYALPDEMVKTDVAVSEELIADKIQLLKNYPSLSSGRGAASDYSLEDPDPLSTINLAGYAGRMRSLLGMNIQQSQPLKDLDEKEEEGGFYVVEHLLLRPVKDGDQLISVCLDGNCEHCGDEDPYSFKVSVVLPFWLKRFENMHFRNYMESLFRNEAPAHVFLKICWVDPEEMGNFETAYSAWVKARAAYYKTLPQPTDPQVQLYSDALKNMIEVLESLRTDFPVATLHDCKDKDEANDTRVFLNQTLLGNFIPTHEDGKPIKE